jgi:hypothetical protein
MEMVLTMFTNLSTEVGIASFWLEAGRFFFELTAGLRKWQAEFSIAALLIPMGCSDRVTGVLAMLRRALN